MSDNLYVQLYLQLVSKLSGRTQHEVIRWALSKIKPASPELDVRPALPKINVGDIRRWALEKLKPEVSLGDIGRWALSKLTEVGISRLIGDVDFQYVYPLYDWWWPEPPEGYIDPNAYLLLSRMPAPSPASVVTKYEASSKDLYSTYRNVLLSAPKIDVDASVLKPTEITEHSKALTESEKPSNPSEDKPGFVKMKTHAGTILTPKFVVADGKDWISELKKKAEEKGSKEGSFIPGGDTGLVGILQNISLDLTTESSPIPLSLKFSTPSDPFFAVYTFNNEWQTFNIPLDDKSVSVSLKIGAAARVPVRPDAKWYDSDYLHTLAKRDSWNPPFTTTDIFSEKGLLSEMINGFIAAYQFAFKITVSPEIYQEFQPIFQAALGFRIGPFHFGLGISISKSGDVSLKPPTPAGWKHNAIVETSTFEGESTADYPTIVGVTVEKILSD